MQQAKLFVPIVMETGCGTEFKTAIENSFCTVPLDPLAWTAKKLPSVVPGGVPERMPAELKDSPEGNPPETMLQVQPEPQFGALRSCV